jgi:hypothetical protein
LKAREIDDTFSLSLVGGISEEFLVGLGDGFILGWNNGRDAQKRFSFV